MLSAVKIAAKIATGLLRNPIPAESQKISTNICRKNKLELDRWFYLLTKNENNHYKIVGSIAAKEK